MLDLRLESGLEIGLRTPFSMPKLPRQERNNGDLEYKRARRTCRTTAWSRRALIIFITTLAVPFLAQASAGDLSLSTTTAAGPTRTPSRAVIFPTYTPSKTCVGD